MDAVVRPFLPSDYIAARALWERTPGIGLSAADEAGAIARFLQRNPRTSFVADLDDDLAGTILCGHDGRRGLIHHLATATHARRQGIARRLLAAGLRALRAEGIDKAHLMVYRANTDGFAFWCAVRAQERVELALFSVLTGLPS